MVTWNQCDPVLSESIAFADLQRTCLRDILKVFVVRVTAPVFVAVSITVQESWILSACTAGAFA